MSTPRHQDYCKFCQGDEGVAAPLCQTCKHAQHTSVCSHKTANGIFCFCGVAAPLEPSDIETFKLNGATSREWAYLHRTRRDGTSGNLGKLLRDFAEAYAAAVSKNLQEERDKLKAELDLVDEALARRPALAHIEHRYNKIFAACAGAAKANLLEKELALLREKLMD